MNATTTLTQNLLSKRERAAESTSLNQLLQEGYYLLYLIRQGHVPQSADLFAGKIETLLTIFENKARANNNSADDIYQAKYAFCALLDETMLQISSPCRDAWQIKPSQLRFFGEHLAGVAFFEKLEEMRAQGKNKEQVLEVMYTCMLLGFKGKYQLESPEKLNYLIGRVGDELRTLRGKDAALSPSWAIPDNVKHIIKHEIPVWGFWIMFGLMALAAFASFNWMLDNHFKQAMSPYSNVIHGVEKQPYLEVTW